MAIATIALMVSVAGCGGNSGSKASQNASQPVAQAQAGTLSEMQGGEAHAEPTAQVADTVGGLPPEVSASVTGTAAKPGDVIEITALGSPDVTGMFLTDGLRRAQPFSYDMDGKLWRTSYRLPLEPMSDHLGFSVTARNEAGRWRRVWVFVNVAPEAEEPQIAPEQK